MGDRRGCATVPYRTPTTLGHVTKTGSHSISTTQKQTQGAAKTRRQRNMAEIKKIDQNSRKRTKQNGDQSDAEFKTPVIKMLKKVSEDLNSIKDPFKN